MLNPKTAVSLHGNTCYRYQGCSAVNAGAKNINNKWIFLGKSMILSTSYSTCLKANKEENNFTEKVKINRF